MKTILNINNLVHYTNTIGTHSRYVVRLAFSGCEDTLLAGGEINIPKRLLPELIEHLKTAQDAECFTLQKEFKL